MEYTTKHLVKLGISRERLRDWINREYVDPKLRASGPGYTTIFSILDLYYILVFKRMVEFGISRDDARERLLGFTSIFLRDDVDGVLDPSKPFLVFFKDLGASSLSENDKKEMILLGFIRKGWFFMDGESLKEFTTKHERIIDNMVIINFKKIRQQVENLS